MDMTQLPSDSHEAVHKVTDAETGLRAIIAIHSTQNGPAAGGLRMKPYDSFEDALGDVLRLSRGMTLKSAAAGLPLGGGKAVILGNPDTEKSPALLRAFGQAVAALQGRYITAEDMGMTPADIAEIATQTQYAAGLQSGSFGSGDPSPITAQGVFNGIRTAAAFRLGSGDLRRRVVAVQGLGHVGWDLCKRLRAAGAEIIVTDISAARMKQAVTCLGARAVDLTEIYSVEADVFAPCAIGGVLNPHTIPQLRVTVVAGAANNQLANMEDADALHARGILYAPDFVVNGGGIVNVATEILKIETAEKFVAEKLKALSTTLNSILNAAKQQNVSPARVAEAAVAQKMRTAQVAE